MGVKRRADPEEKTRLTFTRPEGTDIPIARTQAHKAGDTGHTMAPKRWEERRNER